MPRVAVIVASVLAASCGGDPDGPRDGGRDAIAAPAVDAAPCSSSGRFDRPCTSSQRRAEGAPCEGCFDCYDGTLSCGLTTTWIWCDGRVIHAQSAEACPDAGL